MNILMFCSFRLTADFFLPLIFFLAIFLCSLLNKNVTFNITLHICTSLNKAYLTWSSLAYIFHFFLLERLETLLLCNSMGSLFPLCVTQAEVGTKYWMFMHCSFQVPPAGVSVQGLWIHECFGLFTWNLSLSASAAYAIFTCKFIFITAMAILREGKKLFYLPDKLIMY